MNAFALNRCPTYTFVILESSSSIGRVLLLLSVVEHLLVKGLIRALSPLASALLTHFISVRTGQCMEERLLNGLSTELCKLPVFDKRQSRSGDCSHQMIPSNFGRRKKPKATFWVGDCIVCFFEISFYLRWICLYCLCSGYWKVTLHSAEAWLWSLHGAGLRSCCPSEAFSCVLVT